MKPTDGRRRVVIEDVSPQIDAGRHPVCRIVGDSVSVGAAIFADGKDELAARLLYRHASDKHWRFTAMLPAGNDLWNGSFVVDKLGLWNFTILGWVDHFATWANDLKKRLAAQSRPELADGIGAASRNATTGPDVEPNAATQDIVLALRAGAALVDQAAARAQGKDAKRMKTMAREMERLAKEQRDFYDDPLNEELLLLMAVSYTHLDVYKRQI